MAELKQRYKDPFYFPKAGRWAWTVEELCDICAQHPDAAIEHLDAGHFEHWLHATCMHPELSDKVRAIRARGGDRTATLCDVVRAIRGVTVRGRVIDGDGGGMNGLEVRVEVVEAMDTHKRSQYSATTCQDAGQDGIFTLPNIPAGSYVCVTFPRTHHLLPEGRSVVLQGSAVVHCQPRHDETLRDVVYMAMSGLDRW